MIKTFHPVSHEDDPLKNDIDFEPKCTCCPTGRSGHRIIVADDSLYSLGGYNPNYEHFVSHNQLLNHSIFKELWKINLSTKKWQLIDDFNSVPPTVASHTIAKVGRWLFLFGGTSIPFGETPTSALYRYDLNNQINDDHNSLKERSNRWHLIPVTGDVPEERYGHTMTMVYPDVFIIGGTTGYIYNTDVYHLDLRGPVGIWTKLSSDSDPGQPVGRYRHETVYDGENLYVFGGGTDEHSFSLMIIHVFNLKSCMWGNLKTYPDPQHGFPIPRKCHSCTQYKNDIFMIGGLNGTTTQTQGVMKTFSEIWRFSLDNHFWTKYSVILPTPLFFHSADLCEPKGCIYIFGGVTHYKKNELVRTKRITRLRVAPGNLLELAWDIICDLIQNRWQDVDMNELGIPLMLQARVS
ncbi:kelch domain-containing protein 10 [Biomphalaria pfeifferi]|uniref:Kelch domain-containing protein 10 n=1 Tax=Biomphalaria pfeifferi TaxID=112525 RepID=A0AAD8EW33_BIOPF|nr:kelch domain-containing protein 10 [Biomphalaria pfeifferi]